MALSEILPLPCFVLSSVIVVFGFVVIELTVPVVQN